VTRQLCVQPTADELLDLVGLHRPVGIRWAAILADVSQDQIRQWKRRGHLEQAGADERGRPLYRGIDVLRAQAKAEVNAARTQAAVPATRRESVSA
jgi:hypothetical protein